MQIHTLQRSHKRKMSRSVGRGGKRGKTSGRGTKGQNARAGRKKRPELRDIIKTLPKLRGRGKNIFRSFEVRSFPVNLSLIETHFKAGETVSPATLLSKGLIESTAGVVPTVKILAGGALTKKIVVSGCKISTEAKTKIEAVGGSIAIA